MEKQCKYCKKFTKTKGEFCSQWCYQSFRIYQKEQKCKTCGKIFHHNNTKKYCFECKPINSSPIKKGEVKLIKIRQLKQTVKLEKGQKPTDLNPSYSYREGDETKNERVRFRHWNDLLYAKEKTEKDTTYSSLWLFRNAKEIPPFKDTIGSKSPSQAKKDGKEYFSEFNPLVAENILNFYSDENDNILDVFAGRTRGIVAGLKHRRYFGFEVSPKVQKTVMEIIIQGKEQFDSGFIPIIYCDDSLNLDKHYLPEIDLVFSCPPYFNLEKYESATGQLSDIEDYKEFLTAFQAIMKKAVDKLKDNGFVCLVVGDFRRNDRLIPFDCDTTRLMEELGVVLWDKIIIQNVSMGWASFKFGSLKHKRLTAKVTEYLLVFKKKREK